LSVAVYSPAVNRIPNVAGLKILVKKY
jgi:hypothetical protein